jgi:plasmid stabilization system protein ParE
MGPYPVEFDPRAIAEAREARLWYAARSPLAAARFMAELDQAVARASTAPDTWSAYLHGTRAVRLGRFPHLLVFRTLEKAVQVIAVAHPSRRPGYWRRRVS